MSFAIIGVVTAGLPRRLPLKATLRRRRVTAVPHTVLPVRILFGRMTVDATSFPTGGTGPVGVIEAGVIFGTLRIQVPAGLALHHRVETDRQGSVTSEVPEVGRDAEEPHLVLVGEIVRATISVEQWDRPPS